MIYIGFFDNHYTLEVMMHIARFGMGTNGYVGITGNAMFRIFCGAETLIE